MSSAAFLLLLAAAGAFIWAGLCALFAVPQHLRYKRGYTGYTGKEARRTVIGFAVTGIIGQVIFWMLGLSMLGSVAYSNYCSANANARMVYNIASNYQKEYPDNTLQTMAGCARESEPDESLEYYMHRNLNGHYYFAVVVGTNGKPQAAYWSRKPLNVNSLRGTTRDETTHLYQNPFADTKRLVGEYST